MTKPMPFKWFNTSPGIIRLAGMMCLRFLLLLRDGTPEHIRSDNGPELVAEAMQEWLVRVGIKPIRIYPDSPCENGYNERFNGTLRCEVLNAVWFTTTKQAQIVINHWLRQYNHNRTHQALKMRPPGDPSSQASSYDAEGAGGKTPLQAMKDWHKLKPALIKKQPY